MPKRPEKFTEIIGHPNIVTYLVEHIKNNTLPQFIILDGEEGLGKSSLAKLIAMGITCTNEEKPCYTCRSCQEVLQRVIRENKETESIKLYNMSREGGKDAAKEVEANLTIGLSNITKKVIIMDEAHGMSDAAQDVFLVSTEYLPKGVHIIMCTTNLSTLKPALRSRAFRITLKKLKNSDVLALLKQQVTELGLTVQGGDATLNLIASWANGKPRIGMNLLQGFGEKGNVSSAMVKEFIDYMSVEDILPVIADLGGSITHGLSYISDMKINDSFVDIVIEVLKIKQGQASYVLSMDDARAIRIATSQVREESLIKFIYEIAKPEKLTRQALIAGFIRAHHAYDELFTSNPKEVLEQEIAQKISEAPVEIPRSRQAAPSVEDLLRRGVVVSAE